MKINKYYRPSNCKHCGIEYNQGNSNQKFCKTSCRVSNWQMNNPKKARALKGLKDKPQVNSNSTGKDIATSGLGAVSAIALVAAIEKLFGVHNSDFKKQLDWLVENAKQQDLKMDCLMKEVNKLRKELGEPQSLFNY